MNLADIAIPRKHIAENHGVIEPHVRRTPLIQTSGIDFGLGDMPIAFKLESMQPPGSFKVRGAFTNLLTRKVPQAGVAAASGGNHGAAVAYAAMRLGIKARIFVPTVSSTPKVERIRSYGAELVITGERYGDTLDACNAYVEESGAINVHAFDQYETMLGTGTIGFEVSNQMPDVDTVLVPIGGGGLIAGIASWFATTDVRVIGVEPDGAPTMTRALEAGRPVDAPAGSIANDSLAPRQVGQLVFPVVQQHVERVVLVSDDEIRAAQKALWNGMTTIAEPGGAAAFAALLAGRYVPEKDERVCAIVSGGNASIVIPSVA